MRAHYERWWAPIEPTLRDFAPISIGSPKENPVTLVSSDWEDIYADNPGHVLNAAGGPRGGPWSIFVERDGDYEISLYRWPPQLKLPLNAACPPQKRTKGTLPEGKALPIAGAKLAVAGQEASKQDRRGRHARGIPRQAQGRPKDHAAGLVPGRQGRGPVRLVLRRRQVMIVGVVGGTGRRSDRAAHASCLIDAVDSGASVGFMPPLERNRGA